jgi:phospholipid/cholesterol/gamma-HCH transport system substrate-binding protein
MAQREEQIKVGALVTVAAVLFLTALVFVGGVNLFRKRRVTYTAQFKFAGGLESGSFVRFGGLKVGTVRRAEIDPEDSTRVRITLLVNEGTPIRTNSAARISTLGFLGENYVEISPGTRDAERLKPGSQIPSQEIVQLADVFNNVNNVTLNANKLINDLDEKVLVIANNANQLISNVNQVVGPENRAHLTASLANVDGMLAETRPRLKTTLANIDTATAKIGPTVDSAHVSIDNANKLITHADEMIQEDRQALHDALLRLNTTLEQAHQLMGNLDDTLNANRPNIDDMLENFRASSQNVKQFTDTIKQRPFSLIRVKVPKEHVPPNGK